MKNFFVTGACGFIGSNLIKKLLKSNHTNIIAIDNLSRFGSKKNLENFKNHKNFIFYEIDISNIQKLELVFKKHKPDVLCHLAAQVAVTISYKNPLMDFYTNGLGSINLLSLVFKYNPECYCLYSSTNKVYGKQNFTKPIDENTLENPYTPYGVSKYIGDLYFKEFNTSEFGLKTCVLKQSCIYGPNQFGIEDQGWLVWFLLKNIYQRELSIYGDGNQIRDLLYIDDLINLYILLIKKKITGSYPIGGGINNSISLNKAIKLVENITKTKFSNITYKAKRAGDQDYFVSNNSWLKKNNLKWSPKTTPITGLKKMNSWINQNRKIIDLIYEKKI